MNTIQEKKEKIYYLNMLKIEILFDNIHFHMVKFKNNHTLCHISIGGIALNEIYY